MKTSLIIALLVIFHEANGKFKFDCPTSCPPNVYKPICSRGKSYANLCVLQLEICKGKTAPEIYDDVEACPGFVKEDDASGKSVEAVDKNGVIFRHFIRPKKQEDDKKPSTTQSSKKKSDRRKKSRKGEKKPCFRTSALAGAPSQLYILGNNISVVYPPHSVVCKDSSKNCDRSKTDTSPLAKEKTWFMEAMKRFFDDLKNRDNDPSSKMFCDVLCDPKVYRPVCAGKRTFRSDCYLKKAHCSGSIGKSVVNSAKPCPRSKNKRKTPKEH